MEKLPLYILLCIIVASLIAGFLGGAVGNLFGFGFWPSAGVCAAVVAAWYLGQLFNGR
jgi:hypothetical protein